MIRQLSQKSWHLKKKKKMELVLKLLGAKTEDIKSIGEIRIEVLFFIGHLNVFPMQLLTAKNKPFTFKICNRNI